MYEIISKKRDALPLEKEEIQFVIDSYVNCKTPDYQISALLMAIYLNGLNENELNYLTEIMKNSGDTISLSGIKGKKIDKHSTGGVGDKISFIVVPMVVACGVKVPMLSGRALGHTGGTLDKLESIPGIKDNSKLNVFLTQNEFKKGLEKVGMVISGQTSNITPADKKLYALRDATATVSSIPLISSSIMSKKLALETDGIVLDIKTGSGAFMRDIYNAEKLCRTMVKIGRKAGRKTIGIITNMDQPLGASVGNSLEIIESIEALKGNGDEDIMEITYTLGSAMLIVAGVEKNYQEARVSLQKTIENKKALKVFSKFIENQNGEKKIIDNYSLLGESKYKKDLIAWCDGFISQINAFEIGMSAIDIGAGRRKKEDSIDYNSGFEFKKKVADQVNKGDSILTIHTNKSESIDNVLIRLKNAIKISKTRIKKQNMILKIIDNI